MSSLAIILSVLIMGIILSIIIERFRKKGKELKMWHMFLVVIIITLLSVLILGRFYEENFSDFQKSCEAYGGEYYILENVTCDGLGCEIICHLNDEYFSMNQANKDILGSYSKFFCIKDCAYENKIGGTCVC